MNDIRFQKLMGEFGNMLEKEFRPLRERVDRIMGIGETGGVKEKLKGVTRRRCVIDKRV